MVAGRGTVAGMETATAAASEADLRELDARIALWLGFERVPYEDEPSEHYWKREKEDGSWSHHHDGPPEYTTRIEWAWEVVERLSERFQVIVASDATACLWCCKVQDRGLFERNRRDVAYASADTAPLAICQAAFNAVALPEP